MVFERYWDNKNVQKHMESGDVILGALRINQKNYEEAFVPHPDGSADVFIEGMKMRNRALNGDSVYVKIFPQTKWKIPIETLNENVDNISNLVAAKSPGFSGSNASNNVEDNCTKKHGTNKGPHNKSNKHSKNVVKCPEASEHLNENHLAKPETARFTTLEQLLSHPPSNVNQLIVDSFKKLNLSNGNSSFLSVASEIIKELFQPMRTGKVVGIAEMKHSRNSAGTLKADKNMMALFSPRDCRVPRIKIPSNCCPSGFSERPDDFKHVLFIARITTWSEKSLFPLGQLENCVGEVGSVDAETLAILSEQGVDAEPFSEAVLACLPSELPWKITDEEIGKRRDFRGNVVFTIDPDSARDMDDALSCEYLGDGLYEVGVHIADVSHFVRSDTELDKMASQRSTSVYLVQRVVPMLPRLLCEQLCSLTPGEDRLAFSVVWKMNEDGEVLEEWFGKTVIRSCVKLSYRHAQGFIGEPDKTWEANQLPSIFGDVPSSIVKEKVLQLYQLSRHLKNRRKLNGTLRLDQAKLSFALDPESCLPLGWSVYQQLESMSLIEEFMLLANMAVAHRIYKSHPSTALLRRHPPPQMKVLDEFVAFCANYDIVIDPTHAGSLQKSLNELSEKDVEKLPLLVSLCSKSMQQALYFSSGSLPDSEDWRHYALNVPLYTHFTSPIRRYPDIIVHRQLAQALELPDYPTEIKFDTRSLEKQCQHSNDKKMSAKCAGDKSLELYLSIFIQKCGPLEEEGMVIGVLDHSFDVYIPKVGATRRVYCEKLSLERFSFEKQKKPSMTITWKPTETCLEPVQQKIKVFTKVRCILSASTEVFKWNMDLKHPHES